MPHVGSRTRSILTIRQAKYGGWAQETGNKTRLSDFIDVIDIILS